MKKILIIALFAAVILAGCKDESEENFSDNQSFSIVRTGAYSDKGFYAVDEDDCLVCFIDKNSYTSTPLCSKPNCTHDGSSCNAYYEGLYGVYVNDGSVYVMAEEVKSGSMDLYKLSMDGSEKSKVRTLFQTEGEDTAYSAEFIIHRGVGYLAVNWLQEDGENEREQILYRVSLKDDGMDDVFKVKGYSPVIHLVSTDEDNIYFSSSIYKSPSQKAEDEETAGHCYNGKDGSVTDIPVPSDQMFEACYADTVHSMLRDRDMGTMMDKKLEFFASDIDGNNNRSVYKLENVQVAGIFRDDKYRYIEIEDASNSHMKMVDYDGREICDFNTEGKRAMWSDGENLLFRDYESGKFSLFNIETSKETVIEGTD